MKRRGRRVEIEIVAGGGIEDAFLVYVEMRMEIGGEDEDGVSMSSGQEGKVDL